MVLYSYSIGTVYILLWTFLSGSLLPAFLYCLEVSTVPPVVLRLGGGGVMTWSVRETEELRREGTRKGGVVGQMGGGGGGGGGGE